MTRGQYTALVFAFIFSVFGVILMAVSIGTDHWYRVDTYPDSQSYYMGLWKKCYMNPTTAEISETRFIPSDKKCVYRELVKAYEAELPKEDRMFMHLVRSNVALICTSCVVQFSTLLTLIFGLWPSDSCYCNPINHIHVYRASALLAFIATVAGMAGGICFLALKEFPLDLPISTVLIESYDWSFMLAWISTGLSFCQAIIFVYLCRFTREVSDYYAANKHYLL